MALHKPPLDEPNVSTLVWLAWFHKLWKELSDLVLSGGAVIATQDEGIALSSTVTTLNFVGAGVTAAGAGATTTVTIAGGSLRVEDEGSSVVAAATGMNFAGAGVVVTDAGSNEALVTIAGGGGSFDWGKYIAGHSCFPCG